MSHHSIAHSMRSMHAGSPLAPPAAHLVCTMHTCMHIMYVVATDMIVLIFQHYSVYCSNCSSVIFFRDIWVV